jgi:uncharacterized membrane protein YhaH (DUF805 family)
MVDQNALKSLEDLHRLKTDGVITEEDFEKAKQRLLFGNAAATRPVGTIMPRSLQPVPRPAEEDHLGWITLALKRSLDFEGRSSRKEFWMFQLIYVGVAVLLFGGILDAVAGTGGLILILGVLSMLALTVPLIAVQVRRFHDQDRSGALAFINLVPYLGSLVVYILMAMEGTKGPNQYGPDPWADDDIVAPIVQQADDPTTPVS